MTNIQNFNAKKWFKNVAVVDFYQNVKIKPGTTILYFPPEEIVVDIVSAWVYRHLWNNNWVVV